MYSHCIVRVTSDKEKKLLHIIHADMILLERLPKVLRYCDYMTVWLVMFSPWESVCVRVCAWCRHSDLCWAAASPGSASAAGGCLFFSSSSCALLTSSNSIWTQTHSASWRKHTLVLQQHSWLRTENSWREFTCFLNSRVDSGRYNNADGVQQKSVI